MNTWYEISYKYNNDDTQLRFEIKSGSDILNAAYIKMQDDIFDKIIFRLMIKRPNRSIIECLIAEGYDIRSDYTEEMAKNVIVPLHDVKSYEINYIIHIVQCEGCAHNSAYQRDHMCIYGCLNDKNCK